MKSRDETIASLVDDIVSGTLNHRRICLASVLDAVLDEPLLDTDDTANLIGGTAEQRMDILDRAEKHATAIVMSWLQTDPGGKALVDERMQAEREEAEADEEAEREYAAMKASA